MIGVIIGVVIANVSTTGQAKGTLSKQSNNKMTTYEKYAFDEIDKYIEKNNLTKSDVLVYRKSTDGKLIPSKEIRHFDLKRFTYRFSDGDGVLILEDGATGEIITLDYAYCDTVTSRVAYSYGTRYHCIRGGVDGVWRRLDK